MEYYRAFLQGTISFFAILFLTRISGKQQIAQLTFLDYIVAITAGSIASTMTIVSFTEFGPMLAGLVVWFVWSLIVGFISMKCTMIGKLVNGAPTVLIQNGKILEKNISQLPNYRIDDLRAQLRDKGIFRMADVEFALLETSGQLSVLKKSQQQPVTRSDLNLETEYEGLSRKIIFEGEILKDRLTELNLTEEWLLNELEKQGIASVQDIMYAALDTQGNIYIDRYNDNIENIKDL